jgi:RecA-family ATPase
MRRNGEAPAHTGAPKKNVVTNSATNDTRGRERREAVRLAVIPVAASFVQPPPEPPVLVDGLLRKGDMMVVAGPRAAHKSWLAMNLAVLIGRGYGYFLDTLAIERSARVLICHGELDPWSANRRWRRMCAADGPPSNVV